MTKIIKKESEYILKVRILDSKATIKKIEVSLKRKSRFWLYNTIKYFNLDEEMKKDLVANCEKSLKEVKSLDI